MDEDRLKKLQEFYREDRENPFVLFALAMESQKLGDLPAAEDFFRKLLELDPHYVGAYYHFGKLLESLEMHEEALRIYDVGIAEATKLKEQHTLTELQVAKAMLQEDSLE